MSAAPSGAIGSPDGAKQPRQVRSQPSGQLPANYRVTASVSGAADRQTCASKTKPPTTTEVRAGRAEQAPRQHSSPPAPICEGFLVDVAVIGLGLIGGSLLQALARTGQQVTGFDADPATRALARAAGCSVADSLAAAVASAELVALAVPSPGLAGVVEQLSGFAGLVTDVSSVQGPVRELVGRSGLGRFVGGHPMAGKETSGFAAADPKLFDGCAWVLCLERDTDLADWLILADLVTGLGARAVPMAAAEHDRVVAQISHVPHLFATTLAAVLHDNAPAGTLAAGSFRDGTRVAATRAELIAAMCGGNAAAVRAELTGLIETLGRLRTLLDADDPVAALVPQLRLPSELRQAWPAAAGPATEQAATVETLLALGRAGGWVSAVGEKFDSVTTVRPETVGGPA